MRTLLSLLALAFLLPARIHAAIAVAPGGSGVISFNSLPPVSEWSTRSLAGTELTFTTAAALDAAVQTNRAAIITNAPLDGLGAVPPGQNTLASWSGGGTTALWTRPAANSATLLMATLQNNTGENQTVAVISYTLAQSGTTPAEQAPAHEVFYSLTGEAGTWVKIPALSGGTPGARSATVSLNGVWTNGATLFVLWADDNTTGGVDRGWSLDDIVFTGRPPPTLEVIPDVIADVLQLVFFHARGSNTVPGAQLVYSLDSAPVAARINSTNGLFLWKTTRADAATTNVITIRAADAATPSSSATQSFTVIVRDYVELSLSSVVTRGGEGTNVLLEVATTTPLSNLFVTVRFPPGRLDIPVVMERFLPLFSILSTGTQALARVHFTAVSGLPSAFVPLLVEEPTFARVVPGLDPTLLLNHGRAVVVNREPLVEAFATSNARTLVLYGQPGTNYVVETAASVAGPWQAGPSVTLPTLFTTFDISDGSSTPAIFYRAREGTAASALVTSQSVAPEKTVAPKKVKKPKKKKLPPSRLAKPKLTPQP